MFLFYKVLVTGGYYGSLIHEHTFSGHFIALACLIGSDSSSALVAGSSPSVVSSLLDLKDALLLHTG